MRNLIKKYRGFTLVELLLYMGLLAMFLVVLSELFISIMDVALSSSATSNLAQDSRFILARFSYDVTRAQAITIPAGLGQTSNSLRLIIGGVQYDYSLNGTNLQLVTGVNTDNLNGSDTQVSNLSFTKIGNPPGKPTVKITFTIASHAQESKGYETQTFTTTIGTR